MFGRITAVFACNVAGEALRPLILPALLNLPEELKELQAQCIFCSSPSGWMTSKIFLIWSLFFISEVNERRKKLAMFQGPSALSQPCILFLDGHKSRLNAVAIKLLFRNNIRVVVLPAHSSHITQPFDVGLAGPLKTFFKNQSQLMPAWLQEKLMQYTETAKKRYMRVTCILDAWRKSATYHNIKSAWRKTRLSPFDP